MEWSETGIVLSARRHGETSAILELLTRDHGRHLGLVRGGRSRRQQSALQPGNSVTAAWRARLEEHLGTFTVELVTPRAALIMDDPASLSALSSLSAMTSLIPEREPHPHLYEATRLVLDALTKSDHWPALMARWELGLLEELGFGLDLSECAATGAKENLIYVSPKSARAVSADAGEPYAPKLLELPPFLLSGQGATPEDIHAAFKLTGYFLNRHIFGPRGIKMPDTRARMIGKLP